MCPARGRVVLFPLIVASKIRAPFEYGRLDVGLRLRIRARKHAKGVRFQPVEPGDREASDWICALAEKYGVVKWTRSGWIKESFHRGSSEG